MLCDQWRILLAIQGNIRGISVAQLLEKTELARSTTYRHLKLLQEAGVPLATDTVNGEARYRLLRASELPDLGLNALQIAALRLARQELQPLAGAALVRELDEFLHKLRPIEAQQALRFAPRGAGQPELLKAVDRALHYGRRARIEYRAASRNGASSVVHIEPLLLNVAEGEPYLHAYCVERSAERTYKLARIAHFTLTDEPATYRPAKAPADAFAHSVKAWSGDVVTVKIKLDADVAWRAQEYALVPDQKVETMRDGSVTVEARVSGIVEATNWVLSWGGAAEALEPPALRQAVRVALVEALGKYDGPGPAKAARHKSIESRTRRPASGETRRA
jgi:proteasome accessory factor C